MSGPPVNHPAPVTFALADTMMAVVKHLTAREICTRLAVLPETLRAWVAAGRFPAPVVLPGNRQRWREDDVEHWLEEREKGMDDTQDDEELQELSPLAQAILRVLEGAHGVWLHGAEIARLMGKPDCHRTGTWKRALAELEGRIESDKKQGYRLMPDPCTDPVGPAVAPDGPQ